MQSFWPQLKVLWKNPATAKTKISAPLEGKCLSKSVIYKATVKQDNEKVNTYIGLTCNTFKKRFYSHNHSFKNPDVKQTSLSLHVRKLQEKTSNTQLSGNKLIGPKVSLQ